jgi:hypothetical protein
VKGMIGKLDRLLTEFQFSTLSEVYGEGKSLRRDHLHNDLTTGRTKTYKTEANRSITQQKTPVLGDSMSQNVPRFL